MTNHREQRSLLRCLSLGIIACLLVNASACSSAYIPKRDGRVAIVMKDGAVAYARDGKVYKHGAFGGGLLKAVRGVPAAEDAAHTMRSRLGWGFAGFLGGLACSTIAAVAAVGDPSTPEREGSDIAAITALACLGGSMIGAGYMISAVPYQYDAVNIFNDSLVPVGPVHMPGQPRPPLGQPMAPGQGPPGQYP